MRLYRTLAAMKGRPNTGHSRSPILPLGHLTFSSATVSRSRFPIAMLDPLFSPLMLTPRGAAPGCGWKRGSLSRIRPSPVAQ